MRTRITMIAVVVAAIGAIALVWKFPRTSRAGTNSNSPSLGSVMAADEARPTSKPPGKNPASGGKPSPACLECQKRECWNLVDGCNTLAGNASEGPGAGAARKQLCEQMLECARSTGCDTPVSLGCYCGQTDLGSCLAGKGNGACRQAVEAAAESTEPAMVFKHLRDKTYASGIVEPLLTCETRGCPDECVPYYR